MVYGCVVRSLAGHDKNGFQVVVKTDSGFVYVCNGKSRPLERPKKKNFKHVRKLNTVLDNECLRSNKSIRLALSSITKEHA